MLVGRHRSCGADSPHNRDASCGTPAYLRNTLTAGAQLAGAGHGAVGARVDKTRMDAGNEPDLGLDRIPNEHAAYLALHATQYGSSDPFAGNYGARVVCVGRAATSTGDWRHRQGRGLQRITSRMGAWHVSQRSTTLF